MQQWQGNLQKRFLQWVCPLQACWPVCCKRPAATEPRHTSCCAFVYPRRRPTVTVKRAATLAAGLEVLLCPLQA